MIVIFDIWLDFNSFLFFSFFFFLLFLFERLVIDTLKPLDPQRKCFRLIGGILVERTVAEVLPALEKNFESVRPFSFLSLFFLFSWTFAILFLCMNALEISSRKNEQIGQVVTQLSETLKQKDKEIADMTKKYNIQVKGDQSFTGQGIYAWATKKEKKRRKWQV